MTDIEQADQHPIRPKSDKTTIRWTDWRDREVIREVNHVIDVRDFEGTPGYANLVIAANRDLSAPDIEMILGTGMNERSLSWIKRRRWLFQQPDTDNYKGRLPDLDGYQGRAVTIMRANRRLSLHNLSALLKENGIHRSREWVRRHRCD